MIIPDDVLQVENLQKGMIALKRFLPELYRCYFSRLYNDVDRFADWRWPLYYCASQHAMILEADRQGRLSYLLDTNPGLRAVVAWAQAWSAHDHPLFFVERDMFDACLQTSVPAEFPITEFQMPYEGMTFVLPKGVRQYNGFDLTFIGLSRTTRVAEKLAMRNAILGKPVGKGYEEPFFTITTLLEGCENFIGTDIPESLLSSFATSKDADDLQALNETHAGFIYEYDPNIKEFAPFFLSMLRVALNLVLAMEVQPALLERGRKLTQQKKGERKEIWQPYVIGRKYQIKLKGGVEAGSHASPRMHWRRGHFRRQGSGKRITACANCGCPFIVHSRVAVAAGDPELPREFCMDANCKVNCDFYAEPKNKYETYTTIWLEPMLVAAADKTPPVQKSQDAEAAS